MHAMTGETIKSLGAADRAPPPFYTVINGAAFATAAASEFFTTLGLHVPAGSEINSDLIDSFALIYNFRLAAHSSRLERRKYASEDIAEATTLPPAFWPSARRARMVPDYERALVVGALDLDVLAGQVPIEGIRRLGTGTGSGTPGAVASTQHFEISVNSAARVLQFDIGSDLQSEIFGNLAGQKLGVTLADIDKARTTQAFAKLRTAYAGNDATGFDNEDTIVALLMQGLSVPQDQFKRPWLLGSQRVKVDYAERFATDAANLDKSVTQGAVEGMLRLNVPRNDVGGVVIVTAELLPNRVDERMADVWLSATDFNQLPNALRDIQRPEPVDLVLNSRIDANHTTPGGLYAYEPMNDVWNRDFTRLGGNFYQATPGAGWTENRSAIWQTEIVDPTFSETHYLAPSPFPHDVFADTQADAFEFVCRHDVRIVGLTQIGDVLAENSDDYAAIEGAGE
jgi:hypothetical protein